jgi:hypothetical protein
MNIDFSKLSAALNQKNIIEPREIFLSLTNKSTKYNGYLRDVQTEVLELWYQNRNKKDNIIKMNTGSGKTVVGLLLLKSCINENKGKCVYVVPDNYLVEQVIKEANDLGINVTKDIDNINFISGKAILVINIHKLINGKSVFGINGKIDIDSILIDDVHSCLEIAETKSMISINREKYTKLYQDILDMFYDSLKQQNESNLINIKDGDYASSPMLVPFWDFNNKITELLNKFKDYKQEDIFKFNAPMIIDMLELCDCCISYDCIEISMRNLPIYKISSFENANRRIFMSATLEDDSILIRDFDIDPNINNVICPKNATDIGDRLIITPQAINPNITDEEIKYQLKELSKHYRIVVIVPSCRRAIYWNDVADRIFNNDNINSINNYNLGLDILINRYDGIDLKDDKCRVIVIDGLPNASTNYDQIKESMLSSSDDILREKVQKIEQGMGRGVRSNEDFCGIIIMGSKMPKILYDKQTRKYFSVATLKQIELSEMIVESMERKDIKEFFEVLQLCLNRNEEWTRISRSVVSELKYKNKLNIPNREVKFRRACNELLAKNYNSAIKILEEYINEEKNEVLKGYAQMILAKYINLINPNRAQEVLLSAKKLNKNIIAPINGIRYQKTDMYNEQAKELQNFIKNNNIKPNEYLIMINDILSNLNFESSHNEFEESIRLLGKYIGLFSERPEKEYNNGGPDNLWGMGDNLYYVIECKNESNSTEISKRDCGQLHNSKSWFYKEYGSKFKCIPIIIHRNNKFEKSASPEEDFRILDKDNLDLLKENVQKFAIALCSDISNIDNLDILLKNYNLTKDNFINYYTIKV